MIYATEVIVKKIQRFTTEIKDKNMIRSLFLLSIINMKNYMIKTIMII